MHVFAAQNSKGPIFSMTQFLFSGRGRVGGCTVTRGNRALRDWFADAPLRGEDLNSSRVPAVAPARG